MNIKKYEDKKKSTSIFIPAKTILFYFRLAKNHIIYPVLMDILFIILLLIFFHHIEFLQHTHLIYTIQMMYI